MSKQSSNKTSKQQNKIFATALILLLTFAVFTVLPIANAHTEQMLYAF
jgi:hypothetical protein